MTLPRAAAGVVLAALLLFVLPAEWTAPHAYDEQHRDVIGTAEVEEFPLGVDALGRDRWSRLIHATRLSLTLAIAAALLAVGLAAVIGGAAGYFGGGVERVVLAAVDLYLTIPWLFLLLAVRAALPLNAPPAASLAVTFGLLGLLGWAGPARVVCAAAREFRLGDRMVQAHTMGMSPARVIVRQLLPSLTPLLLAQFWIAVPLFILSEANLGLLGLSVSEPLPSWGNLLAELLYLPDVVEEPALLAPAALLVAVVCCIQLLTRHEVNHV